MLLFQVDEKRICNCLFENQEIFMVHSLETGEDSPTPQMQTWPFLNSLVTLSQVLNISTISSHRSFTGTSNLYVLCDHIIQLLTSDHQTNILISDSGDACLCDFGLSRVIKREGGPSGFTTSNFAGSVRYMAPELFRESEDEECMPIVNTATDIYAVGCIGLEVGDIYKSTVWHWSKRLQMATDQIPYANRNLESQVIYDIICGVLPAREPSRFTLASNPTLGKLWNMMLATWNEDANSRPDINAVMKMVADCMPHSELPLVAASQAPLNIPTALRSRTSSQARVYTETSTSSYYTQLDHREPLASSILTNSTLPSSAKSFLRCRSADLPSQDDRLSSSLPRNPFTKRRHSASSVLDGSTIIGWKQAMPTNFSSPLSAVE